MEKVKITYNQAIEAIIAINPPKIENGVQVRGQSELSKAKGEVARQIHFLKRDIKTTFKPYDDRFKELQEQETVLLDEQKRAKTLVERDRISKQLAELTDEYEDLYTSSEEIELRKGKLLYDDIEHLCDSDMLDALFHFIQWDESEEKEEEFAEADIIEEDPKTLKAKTKSLKRKK